MSTDRIFEPAEIGPPAESAVSRCQSEFVGVVRADGAYRLVAVRPVAAGACLFRIEGEKTHQPTRYSIQIGRDLHIDLAVKRSSDEIFDRYYWRFMNHSCDPNTLVRGEEVIACRDIEPWTEVTFNYNTTEYDMAEPFDCRCRSPRCGGTIRGFKHLTPKERERLGPTLAPHLVCLLRPGAEAARK
jgi:hypothetical protein